MNKLFKVKIQFESVIAAENDSDVLSIIEKNLREHDVAGHGGFLDSPNLVITDVLSVNDLPDGWDGDCIPWGDLNEDETIDEILSNFDKNLKSEIKDRMDYLYKTMDGMKFPNSVEGDILKLVYRFLRNENNNQK